MLSKKPLVGVLVLSLAFAGLAGTSVVVVNNEANANIVQTSTKAEEDIQTVLRETNLWREWVGLNTLRLNPQLSEVAQAWSVEVSNRQKQDHNPYYSQQIPAGWVKAGENIGFAWPADQLVSEGWLQSMSHNANVYGDYTDVGIGITYDAKGYPWYVAVYAKYRTVEANPIVQHNELEITENSTKLVWSRPPVVGNVTKFTVEITDEAGNPVATQDTTNSYLNVTGLQSGTTYKYRVIMEVTSLDGATTAESVSDFWSFTTKVAEVVEEEDDTPYQISATYPSNVKAAPTTTTMNISWSPTVVNLGSLKSYVVGVYQGNTKVKEYTTSSTNVSATGLKDNTKYRISVKATVLSPNKVNSLDLDADDVEATTVKILSDKVATGTPNSFAVAPTYNSAKLTWKAPSGVVGKVTGYTAKVTGPSYSKTATTTSGTANFTGLRENTKYTVTLYATAQSESGKVKANSKVLTKTITTGFSQASKVSVSPVQKLSKSKITKSSVYVTFSKPKTVVGKITNYKVQVTGKGFNKSYNNKNGKITVKGLKKNTKYTVKVTAYASSTNGKYKKTATTSTTFTTKR